MTSQKIIVVIDKSEAYLNFKKNSYLEQWGVSNSEIKKITSLSDAGTATLFGDSPTSILNLTEPNEVKAILTELDNIDLSNSFESGLIITCSVPRTQTKKLESRFKALGAEVITPPSKSDDPLPIKLVSELNLNPQVKNFLLAYVGDDYDSLLPLVDSLSKIPKNKHRGITEEDIYIRLPQPPGAVPPWSIEKPLMRGDTNEMLDIFRRTHQHTNLLVVLATLKNKIQLFYRVAALTTANPRITNDQISETLQVANNYPLRIAKDNAKKYGLTKIEKAVKLITKAEADIKGGSAASNVAIMEKTLIELSMIFSGKEH